MSSTKNKFRNLLHISLLLALCMGLNAQPAQAQVIGPVSPSAEISAAVGGLPTQQIIILYKVNATAARKAIGSQAQMDRLSAAAQVDLTYLRAMAPVLDTHVLRLPSSMPLDKVEALAARLEALPEVEYAVPDHIVQIADGLALPGGAPQAIVPSDPLYQGQWHLSAPVSGSVGINLPAAWDFTKGNPNLVTAVLDTGVLMDHPDLIGNFKPGYDMVFDVTAGNDGDGQDPDPSDPGDWCNSKPSTWHGTHVAGTIGAWNPTIGGTGIAPNSFLQSVRVLGSCTPSESDVADGMLWAAGYPVPPLPTNANPARVMNMSVRGLFECPAIYQ